VFKKSGNGKQLCFCACKKFSSGVDQFPKFGGVEAMRVPVTNYASKPKRPALFPVRLKSRLGEFLGLPSSFVPKSRCPKNTEERQMKILLVTPLGSFHRTNGFLAVGLDCCAILLSIEVENSGLSAHAVFSPQ
jgi:hypothetical protein